MDIAKFQELREQLIAAGYGKEIVWAESVQPPANADDFIHEYIWVILCSGMKEQIARRIERKVLDAIVAEVGVHVVFGHHQKAEAISKAWSKRECIFCGYQAATDKMIYLRTLPFIGPITQYHLAKNLGVDCVKPDRHLTRIAVAEGKTPDALCRELAESTGYRLATVDVILWRAANLGFL